MERNLKVDLDFVWSFGAGGEFVGLEGTVCAEEGRVERERPVMRWGGGQWECRERGVWLKQKGWEKQPEIPAGAEF